MINWRVRIKNKTFWVTLVPALLILTQQILKLFNVELNLSDIQAQILAIIDTFFIILSVLGIVTDPTTEGVGDSTQALTYDAPKGDN